ncbi:MAG: CHAD domain-containing protein, partial [Planctomycetota bacterium]
MALPSDLLSRSPAEAVRRVALDSLDEARKSATRLLEQSDSRSLHDFRVAIRRLRSTLRAWRPEFAGSVGGKHRRKLKDVQNATNASRDSEVGLEWLAKQDGLEASHDSGRAWLVRRLEKRLAKSQARVRESLSSDFRDLERRLRPRLETLHVDVKLSDDATGQRFGSLLATRLREHSERLSELLIEIKSAASPAPAHTARIQLKRLRYLAEPAECCVSEAKDMLKSCKQMQDILGELNDLHVLGAELDDALDEFTSDSRSKSPAPERAGLLELALRSQARREELFATL